jgi:orotate phosphoribosyltransferase
MAMPLDENETLDATDWMAGHPARQTLLRLLREATKRGEFTLASGQRSSYYVDARRTTMHPHGQRAIGQLGLGAIRRLWGRPDSVGGLTMGADPVAYAIAHASADSAHPIRAFSVRQQAKDHGLRRFVEGPFERGDRAVVVEDVITTGASALKAVAAARSAGAEVIGILGVLDREAGGVGALRDALGVRVECLATLGELG